MGSIPCIDVAPPPVGIFIVSVICICGIADQSNSMTFPFHICIHIPVQIVPSTRLQHCYTYHFLFCISYFLSALVCSRAYNPVSNSSVRKYTFNERRCWRYCAAMSGSVAVGTCLRGHLVHGLEDGGGGA